MEGFLKGEGQNSELSYPIRLYMISGRRGGGGGVESLIISRSSPHHTFKWNGPRKVNAWCARNSLISFYVFNKAMGKIG